MNNYLPTSTSQDSNGNCYNGGSFDAYIISQEYKDKIINSNGTWGFNVIRPTMPMSMDERESFHYTIENITGQNHNITKDITKYNYWVLETSPVSPLFVSLPYHEPFRSIEYVAFFLTSLFTSYSLYIPIFISKHFSSHDLKYLQRYFQQLSLFYKEI